jgi:hypothetical protein
LGFDDKQRQGKGVYLGREGEISDDGLDRRGDSEDEGIKGTEVRRAGAIAGGGGGRSASKHRQVSGLEAQTLSTIAPPWLRRGPASR